MQQEADCCSFLTEVDAFKMAWVVEAMLWGETLYLPIYRYVYIYIHICECVYVYVCVVHTYLCVCVWLSTNDMGVRFYVLVGLLIFSRIHPSKNCLCRCAFIYI